MPNTSLLIICIFITSLHLRGQTRTIDLLKKEIVTAGNPVAKLQAILAFCEQRHSLSTDTLCKYASAAKEISLIQQDVSKKAMAEYNIASCLVKRGQLDTALKICEDNIRKISNLQDAAAATMKLVGLKAQILIRTAKIKEGIAEVYKVLAVAEQNRDTVMQMVAKNSIGWANMEMDQPAEALSWFYKALQTSDNPVHHEKNSNLYSNIAAVYKQLQKNDSAEQYIQKAIAYSRKNENLFFLTNSLNIQADIFIASKRSHLAEAPLNEALSIRKQIGDPYYIVSDISQLAIYYANTAQAVKGIKASLEGIEVAKQYNLYSKLPYLYYALGENHKVAGDYKQYSATLEKIMAFKDSMYVANSAEAKAELDTRYEVKKKEDMIKLQKLEIANKNYLFYGSILVLVFTLVMAWLLFRGYKKNQQIRLLKMQAEEKQLAAKAVLTARESERKRISRDLHDNIGAYATVLMANAQQLKNRLPGEEIPQIAGKISTNVQNIMGSLQETIWVLNNEVITITDFIDRFKMYAKKMLQNIPGIQIRYKEQLEKNIEMSPAEALHLFRIMQEALQNTIKHAGPQNILVTVQSDEMVRFSIKDDGVGFDEKNIENGNGLLNMKHRASEAGYELKIISGAQGTEVSLEKDLAIAV